MSQHNRYNEENVLFLTFCGVMNLWVVHLRRNTQPSSRCRRTGTPFSCKTKTISHAATLTYAHMPVSHRPQSSYGCVYCIEDTNCKCAIRANPNKPYWNILFQRGGIVGKFPLTGQALRFKGSLARSFCIAHFVAVIHSSWII
jgi:hypothetical protein